jgi:S-adenosylmethionine decarboxylase proenzyme
MMVRMHGLHLTADLHGCAARALLADAPALRAASLAAVQQCGLTPVGELFHPFAAGGGVTGVVLLAESHLALHTWPELAAVTLDVYVCNRSGDHSAQARQVMAAMQTLFRPARVEQREVMRGALTA